MLLDCMVCEITTEEGEGNWERLFTVDEFSNWEDVSQH